MPEHKSSKASARQVLASELARLREEAGRSLGDLADLTTFDRSYLHKLEKGAKLGSTQVMAALDGVYDTDRHLQLLWELAKDDAFRDRYKRFMELEREATVRYEFVAGTIPGLLQTEACTAWWRPRSPFSGCGTGPASPTPKAATREN